MEQFIINNTELAQAAGVSKQYFSTMKSTYSASAELAQRLEKITKIPSVCWVSPKKRNYLSKELKKFFIQQKIAKELHRIPTK